LYGRLIPVLQAQGYRTLIAAIAIPNEPSERLHRAFGFAAVGTLARVGWKFGAWHDVVYWQRLFDVSDGAPGVIMSVGAVCVNHSGRADCRPTE
jgi:phosphinothricin acetyltransferase